MGVPSLERICIEVVATHDYWIMQKRHIQCLPEHAANHLLQLLLHYGRLQQPKQLDVFRHSVTALHVDGRRHSMQGGGQRAAEWVAYVAGFGHLRQLSLTHAPRLRDRQLAPLARLASSLTALDLTACSGLGRASCLQVIGGLTNMAALVLTDTSVRPPFMGHLTHLTALTQLHLGGCEVTDAEITTHITTFKQLRQLVLWGASAGDVSVPYLTMLPHLHTLNMAWSKLHAALPFSSSLKCLDLSHCTLDANWEDITAAAAAAAAAATDTGTCSAAAAATAAAAAVGAARPTAEAAGVNGSAGVLLPSGLEQLLLRHTAASAATCEVLALVLRSSSSSLALLDLTGFRTPDLLPVLLSLETASGLRALSLAGTHLQDDYCPTLVMCAGLATLDLSQNPEGLTGTGLAASLPALLQLQRLNLAGCAGVGDDVLPVLATLPQLQQLVLAGTAVTWEWEGTTAAAAAASSSDDDGKSSSNRSSSSSRSMRHGHPWQQLQLLDVTNTQITDTGCLQLSKQFVAQPASEHPTQTAAAAGGGLVLRVLLIGSSRVKLGKQALAAVARITSLEQLTLQRWQLVDTDPHVLSPLQQLQQLHVNQCDPWLLSDDALSSICLGKRPILPDLRLLVRDERVLVSNTAAAVDTAVAAAAEVYSSAGGADAAGSPIMHTITRQQYSHWLSSGSDHDGVGVYGSWPSVACAAVSAAGKSTFTAPTAAAAAGGRGKAASPAGASSSNSSSRRRSSKSGGRSATSSATVYARLSDYDERYRYSSQQLLQLNVGDKGMHHGDETAAAAGVAGADQGAGAATSSVLPPAAWVGVGCIPDAIRIDKVDGSWRRA